MNQDARFWQPRQRPDDGVRTIKAGIARWKRLAALAGAAVLFGLGVSAQAAPNAECDRLRRAIADASRSSQGGQVQAAAERRRAASDRPVAYSREIGCDNRKFLFFGSDPPAQCGQIRSQIGRMRANLDDL